MPEPLPLHPTPPAPKIKSRLMDARLIARDRISPSFWRLRLAGDFDVFLRGGLHFRLAIGPEGSPPATEDASGTIHWPGGIECWHRPPYTVRAVSEAADWIDIDIFIHQGGRITEWCEGLRPGDALQLTGPGGRGIKPAAWMCLIGDETALPVILRALSTAAPDTQGQAFVLIPDAKDAQEVALPQGITLRWITRDQGKSLLELLDLLTPPAENRSLFFAGERAEVDLARARAAARGWGSGEFHGATYWTVGTVPSALQRQAKGIAVSAFPG